MTTEEKKNYDFVKRIRNQVSADGRIDIEETELLLDLVKRYEGVNAEMREFEKILVDVRRDGIVERDESDRVLYFIDWLSRELYLTEPETGFLGKLFKLNQGRTTVNMDGVCVHLPVFVILAANMFGHHLSVVEIGTLCLSIMFASVGAGGIPGGSVFLLFMVLENMGLPAEQVTLIVALCLGINPILDMFETCCNVTGDNVCTYIVAKKNGMVN